jgi:hypothetical protein
MPGMEDSIRAVGAGGILTGAGKRKVRRQIQVAGLWSKQSVARNRRASAAATPQMPGFGISSAWKTPDFVPTVPADVFRDGQEYAIWNLACNLRLTDGSIIFEERRSLSEFF